MMKSRLSSKNLARAGLSVFIIACLIIAGCSSSTSPSYLREHIEDAITSLSKKEYAIDLQVKLLGQTLWIYMPVKTIVQEAKKPEKYIEKFSLNENTSQFQAGELKIEYFIKSVVPPQEKKQEFEYTKDVSEKMNDVLMVMRRVLFSVDRSRKAEPDFICFITADMTHGYEVRQLMYYPDLKKVSYGFISVGEYQHRAIQDSSISPLIVGDKKGAYIEYRDISFNEFIAAQIQHRIRLKFQKPEVEPGIDIDKEILKIAILALKTYNFRDFSMVKFSNLLTYNRFELNQPAMWDKFID